MIIRPSQLDPFFLNLDTLYQRGYMNAETTYDKYCQTIMSGSDTMLHGWMDRVPQVREWVGPRIEQNLVAQDYMLKNKRYELTLVVQRTDIEDDRFGLYAPQAEMLGMQAKQWPDTQMTTVLEAGASTLTFDGAFFFSASHPIDTTNSAAGTQSNLYTSTALTAANVAVVDAGMMNIKGRDGLPIGARLDTIMVPPALKHKALQIANAEFIVAADGINAATGGSTNVLKGAFNVIVNPKLTSDTTWYAFCNAFPIKGLIWQLRLAPEFTYLVNPTDPGVFSNDQYTMGCRMRGVGGYGLYFFAAQCTA